jgi:ABC-type sugar transport system permease subunit
MKSIKDVFYDISVKLYALKKPRNKNINMKSQKLKDAIFCGLILLIPTIQFFVFYIGVHFNSLMLATKSYDIVKGSYEYVGLENIIKAFNSFSTETVMQKSLRNSLILYMIGLFVGSTFAILFSYAIFKKVKGYNFLRVMLFFPSIISPIVMVLIFRNFVGSALPYIIQKLTGAEQAPLGLLANSDTQFGTLIFYTIWIGFGSSVLLYSGAMSGINEAVIEAAKIDGVNDFQELVHIVLPLVYPTFSTFIVVGVAAIFTNQMNLYSFYGTKPISYDLYTIGYYLYRETSLITGNAGYPPVAALGICISVFTIPLTLFAKWLLNKLGPKTE